MQNDRVAASRHAEQLVREGRLDAAIAEYRRLLELQPRDWNTANLLGDLLVKREQTTEAVALFARAAETQARDGFAARACALYKKILKLEPASDAALLRAGELSAAQGLVADARRFMEAAAAGRRSAGDEKGALDVEVRIRLLVPVPMAVQTATDDQPVAVPPLEPAAAAPARVSPEQSAGPEESIKSTSEQRAGPAPVKSIEPTPERGSVPDVSSAEAAPAAAPPPADIEQIFARLRQDAATGTTDQVAHIAYTRGLALLDAGDATGGIEQLQAAARSLRYRFDAGVRLAREHERRHRLNDAIDWLGRALEATPDAADARYDTLLHLATLLEQEGESARALATCLELQADAGSYRDVDARIARLTREQAGG